MIVPHRVLRPALCYGLAALLAFLLYFRVHFDAPIDGFHEGEYLANRFYFSGAPMHPVMIHGMMDVFPSLWAIRLFGLERAVAGTRLINETLGFLTCLIFFGIMASLAHSRAATIVAMATGAVVLCALNWMNVGVVDMQQGAPAMRDLFLMLVILLLVRAKDLADRHHAWLTALAGVTAGLSSFWAYNRGVAVVAGLIVYAIVLAAGERSVRNGIPVIAGIFLGLILNYVAWPDAFQNHVHSILYWQSHEYIWKYKTYSVLKLILVAMCVIAILCAGLTGLYKFLSGFRKTTSSRTAALLLFLAFIALFTFYNSFNRFDRQHVSMAVPFSLIAGVAGCLALRDHIASFVSSNKLRDRSGLAAIAVVALLVVALADQSHAALAADLRYFGQGLPRDRAIASDNALKVADTIRAAGGPCAYTLDNESIYYHLAGLRSCSNFLVPVYAGRDVERSVLDDLRHSAPAIIILRSNTSSMAIDGLDQAQRTPAIVGWARSHYTSIGTFAGVDVARRNAAQAAGKSIR